MADEINLSVGGIDELKRALAAVPEKLRRKGLLKALRSAGKVVQGAARQAAPVLQQAVPYRTRGLVKRKISVRTSKFAKQAGDVGVFVGVRPAAGAKFRAGKQVRATARGKDSPLDPYYWRWLEFGTKKMQARPFLSTGGNKLDEALGVFMDQATDEINALDRPT